MANVRSGRMEGRGGEGQVGGVGRSARGLGMGDEGISRLTSAT